MGILLLNSHIRPHGFDTGIRLPRKTPSDCMADMLNRILKTLESITDIRTAVRKSGWIYPGSSLLIAHGLSKFTRKTEVRCALIDFAYAHEHNNELNSDEVDDGLGTLSKMLNDRAIYLQPYLPSTTQCNDIEL